MSKAIKYIVGVFLFALILDLLCGMAMGHIISKIENPLDIPTAVSEKSFDGYIEEAKKEVSKYDYTIEPYDSDPDEYSSDISRGLIIKMGEEEVPQIQVHLNNYVGEESVEVIYISKKRKMDSEEIPVELFVNLINIVSSEKVSLKEVEEFLNAPESKYYDFLGDKAVSRKISKRKEFDNWGRWNLEYALDTNDREDFAYNGYTKEQAESVKK